MWRLNNMPRIPRRIARQNVLEHGLAPDGEPLEPVEEVVEAKPKAKKKTTKKSKTTTSKKSE
tara:strand:- start:2755 stop:2940 length:186 start_codon:yes stop_codon:yes gene_type:complete